MFAILTTVKIFQFLHSPYCISGQYVLCRKENLIAQIAVESLNICEIFGLAGGVSNMFVNPVGEKEKLSDIFCKIAVYLPQMYDVIWAVDSGRKVIGYIVVDKNGQVQYEF